MVLTHCPFPPTRQTGVALVVALIFLLILSLLGIAALGNTTLQTRMTYGAGEANLAFHSAEMALVAGERWLGDQRGRPSTGCATSSNTTPIRYTPVAGCNQNAGSATAIWPRPDDLVSTPPVGRQQLLNPDWWADYGRRFGWRYEDGAAPVADGGQPLDPDTLEFPPRYVIEELGPELNSSKTTGQVQSYRIYYYQVTARASGEQSTTQVVTQSVYAQGY